MDGESSIPALNMAFPPSGQIADELDFSHRIEPRLFIGAKIIQPAVEFSLEEFVLLDVRGGVGVRILLQETLFTGEVVPDILFQELERGKGVDPVNGIEQGQ